MVATLLLRLGIWFLLTADLSLVNIVLGVTIAVLLHGKPKRPIALREWLRSLGRFLVILPQSYLEYEPDLSGVNHCTADSSPFSLNSMVFRFPTPSV